MKTLREHVHVEQLVFYRLSQATRDDSSGALYSIAMELARLGVLLDEALGGLAR